MYTSEFVQIIRFYLFTKRTFVMINDEFFFLVCLFFIRVNLWFDVSYIYYKFVLFKIYYILEYYTGYYILEYYSLFTFFEDLKMAFIINDLWIPRWFRFRQEIFFDWLTEPYLLKFRKSIAEPVFFKLSWNNKISYKFLEYKKMEFCTHSIFFYF